MTESDGEINNDSSFLFNAGTISPSSKSTSSTCSEPEISQKFKAFGVSNNSKFQQNSRPTPKDYQVERTLRQELKTLLFELNGKPHAEIEFDRVPLLETKICELISKAFDLHQFRAKSIGCLLQHHYPNDILMAAVVKPSMFKGFDRLLYRAFTSGNSGGCSAHVELVPITCIIHVDEQDDLREVSRAEKELLGVLGKRIYNTTRRYQLYVHRFGSHNRGQTYSPNKKGLLAAWRSYRNDWEDDSPVRFLNEAPDFYQAAVIANNTGHNNNSHEIQYNTYAMLIKK